MNISPKAAANQTAKAATLMAMRIGVLSIIQLNLASMAIPSCAIYGQTPCVRRRMETDTATRLH
jgi:hypothetical protein